MPALRARGILGRWRRSSRARHAIATQGTTYTDEGVCISSANAAYGMDGNCMMGGEPAACAFITCANTCFANDPQGKLQASWDCYCTNTKQGASSQCLDDPMQTDTSTCRGKLAADTVALQAEDAFEKCVYVDTCAASCV